MIPARPPFGLRAGAVATLLFLAPWVGEYLLGNVPVQLLPALPILATLYGGGALLVREIAVRGHGGWAALLLLGAAYGVIEAGLVDQSMFNPDFEGHDFQAVTPVPLLGISALNAIGFVVGHAIWSIALPIAFTGFLFPSTRDRPLCGPVGLGLGVLLYLFGCWIIFQDLLQREGFLATPRQMLGALGVALLLVGAALRVPADGGVRWRLAPPRPVLTGLGAFVATSAFMLIPESWAGVVMKLLWLAAAWGLGFALAMHPSWRTAHSVALGGGALLTYAWLGPVLTLLLAPGDAVRYAGNAAFAGTAVGLIALAAWRTRRAAVHA